MCGLGGTVSRTGDVRPDPCGVPTGVASRDDTSPIVIALYGSSILML